MRVVIGGGPGTGKTTLSKQYANARHTDSLMGSHDWSAGSEEVARWLDAPGDWCVEGISTCRAIRKWLASHPTGKPCDLMVWMREPKRALTKQQMALLKGCETVLGEVRAELVRRGVRMEFR